MTNSKLPSMGRRHDRRQLAMLGGIAVVVAGGFLVTTPDLLLFNGFQTALSDHARSAPAVTAAGRSAEREGALLRTTSLDGIATTTRSFTVGDRISMHGKDGRDATYEVVDVLGIEPMAARVRTVAGPRLLLVTARPTEPHTTLRPLRFVVEADDTDLPPPPVTPRAL